MSVNELKIIAQARAVLEIEARSIADLSERIQQPFVKACEFILNCQGRIIVTGMGKSGHVGRKIAATLASTGTPAHFVHPAEASHGDIGMITRQDVVLALSNSGETDEILKILPVIKRLGVVLITLTGAPHSTLAKLANINLDVSIQREACPLGLAPTASTTAALAMGDALALSILDARGFTAADFAFSHPGGRLGRQLLIKIEDVMLTDAAIPRVVENTPLKDAVVEMTRKRLGMTTVVKKDDENTLVGIYTDGDLRRTLEKGLDIHNISISEVMTKNFKTILVGTLAIEALRIMEACKITALPVLNTQNALVGALNIHDLFRANVL